MDTFPVPSKSRVIVLAAVGYTEQEKGAGDSPLTMGVKHNCPFMVEAAQAVPKVTQRHRAAGAVTSSWFCLFVPLDIKPKCSPVCW